MIENKEEIVRKNKEWYQEGEVYEKGKGWSVIRKDAGDDTLGFEWFEKHEFKSGMFRFGFKLAEKTNAGLWEMMLFKPEVFHKRYHLFISGAVATKYPMTNEQWRKFRTWEPTNAQRAKSDYLANLYRTHPLIEQQENKHLEEQWMITITFDEENEAQMFIKELKNLIQEDHHWDFSFEEDLYTKLEKKYEVQTEENKKTPL